MHAPMYCDHRICMYHDHRICMYYDHGTCTPRVHKSYDSNPCQWSAPDCIDFWYPMPSIAPRHHASQKSWSNAWYIWKSENKVVISRREGRTSMSPRSNEKHTYFGKVKDLSCGLQGFQRSCSHGWTCDAGDFSCFLVKKVRKTRDTHHKIAIM